MKKDLNKKIEEIYHNFKYDLQKAKDEKDRRISELMSHAEEEYINKIKKDINL